MRYAPALFEITLNDTICPFRSVLGVCASANLLLNTQHCPRGRRIFKFTRLACINYHSFFVNLFFFSLRFDFFHQSVCFVSVEKRSKINTETNESIHALNMSLNPFKQMLLDDTVFDAAHIAFVFYG